VGSRDEWNAECEAFGKAVRARREHLGWSQEELAERTKLDRTYISGIERGVRNPTLKVIRCLAKGLGTRTSKLFAAAESS
jgi:transcriptional regulator with XRE-family HTH domain